MPSFLQAIVHNREPTDGHGEDFRKFLEPVFELLPPVVVSFPEQVSEKPLSSVDFAAPHST
jgi:hypothetical protein